MSPATAQTLGLTRHAQCRAQERSIPKLVIELLITFGASRPSVGGAEKVFFDQEARRAIRTLMGGRRGVRTIERWFNTCAILGEQGSVITLYRE